MGEMLLQIEGSQAFLGEWLPNPADSTLSWHKLYQLEILNPRRLFLLGVRVARTCRWPCARVLLLVGLSLSLLGSSLGSLLSAAVCFSKHPLLQVSVPFDSSLPPTHPSLSFSLADKCELKDRSDSLNPCISSFC